MSFQINWDSGGVKNDHGQQYYLKFPLAIPLQNYYNGRVISRSRIDLENKPEFDPPQTGLGNLTQTFFLTPTFHDETFKLGIGSAFLISNATEKQLGNKN